MFVIISRIHLKTEKKDGESSIKHSAYCSDIAIEIAKLLTISGTFLLIEESVTENLVHFHTKTLTTSIEYIVMALLMKNM